MQTSHDVLRPIVNDWINFYSLGSHKASKDYLDRK